MKQRYGLLKVVFNVLVVGSLLGCSFVSSLVSKPTYEPLPPAPTWTGGEITPVSVPTALPRLEKTALPSPTAVGKATLDEISVDYVYTAEMITVIFPLYGSVLDDFVIVTVQNSGSQTARLLVESEIQGYTDKAIDTVDVAAGDTLEVRQNPLLKTESIDQLNAQKPASFHLRVALLQNGEERTILDETGGTTLFARRDYPWKIEGFTQHENFELLTSMVTPNDPAVEALIRAAAEYTDTGTMWNGYGGDVGDSEGKVWDRLQALWQAEARDYDLTYISTMVSYAPGDVQRIRLPAEVLEQRSGNCIELALLFASATEALELETALIRIPGHAYMAVRTDLENANYYVIETTMIGRADFAYAVDYGNQEFEDMMPHLSAGEELYDWITIYEAREKGILPLPWH